MSKFKRIATIVAPRPAVAPAQPYRDGGHAYETGQRSTKNPYRWGSTDYDLWVEGWRDAEFRDNTKGVD